MKSCSRSRRRWRACRRSTAPRWPAARACASSTPATGCCREGDPADEFFLIRRGAVAIETEVPGRGAVTLETLGPGEILGWSWLVPPYRSAFGARALDAVHVIALDGACLRGKCERDPALGFDLLKVVATVFVRRLEETRMRLLDLYAGVPHAG